MAFGGESSENLDFVSLGDETVNCADKKNDNKIGGAAGGLVAGKPMICGGYLSGQGIVGLDYKKCIEAGNPSNSVEMSVPRVAPAGIYVHTYYTYSYDHVLFGCL